MKYREGLVPKWPISALNEYQKFTLEVKTLPDQSSHHDTLPEFLSFHIVIHAVSKRVISE